MERPNISLKSFIKI